MLLWVPSLLLTTTSIGYRGERMVEAHRFFSEKAREWLVLSGRESC